MQKRYRLKPGRVPSGVGFFVGLVFVLIGLFVIIPICRKVASDTGFAFPFIVGILWTLIAVAITAFHGVNAFSSKGNSILDLEIEEQGGSANGNASRLRELERLHQEKLVSDDEYEQKRQEILSSL